MYWVGFIVDGHLADLSSIFARRCPPWAPLFGWPSRSAIGIMRFEWIAAEVNATSKLVRYELFRPWRRYRVVIFLKSMSGACYRLARKLRQQGTRVIFDLNVDYLSPPLGADYYDGMQPTDQQRQSAKNMIAVSDGIIADSGYLTDRCAEYHQNVRWISDNVNFALVPQSRKPKEIGKLTLFWSGEAVKLFELLSIERVLIKYATRVRLVLITNSFSAFDRWHNDLKSRFERLLSILEYKVIRFESIEHLLDCYTEEGVVISPRFLDNTYNFGHTEWKIALGMACGKIALCSPIPSYLDVSRRSGGRGIRVCRTDIEWEAALDEMLDVGIDRRAEEGNAKEVILKHYSTEVVADAHQTFVSKIAAGCK